MRCPFCGTEETRVLDSRLTHAGDAVRRRRQCVACAERFTSYERAVLTLPRVVKRDRSREAFDEGKIRRGLLRALEKRPVSEAAVAVLIGKLQRRLWASGDLEVSSDFLGCFLMQELRALDEVAYVRFASVYRRFQDIHAFQAALSDLADPALDPDRDP